MVIAAAPCQCGCGQLTGGRKGRPAAFRPGHNRRAHVIATGLRVQRESSHVSVAPLREAFEASGMSASEVAVRLGWFDVRGFADGPRVRRTLGLKAYPPGHGYPARWRESVKTRTAVRLADALGLLPVEIGL